MPTAREPHSPNHVLASVSRRACESIRAHMEPVEVHYRDVLCRPGGEIEHVYFPLDCVISLLAPVDSAHSIEVGMVGCEGMVGVQLLLGASASAIGAVVQASGTALRMTPERFTRQVDAEAQFRQALLRYTHGLMCQFSQTAACNRFHQTEARLARWLLMTADRLRATSFYLTQEFLSQMLGVRRESVSAAAHAMEDRGLIHYSRGKVNIRDRMGLETTACSCYATINRIQNAGR